MEKEGLQWQRKMPRSIYASLRQSFLYFSSVDLIRHLFGID